MPLGNRTDRSGRTRRLRRLVLSGLSTTALVSGVALAGPARAVSTDGPPAVSGAVAAGAADGLLVRFDPSASDASIVRAVSAAGGHLGESPGSTGYVRVSTGDKSAAEIAARLERSPIVSEVGPNTIRHADALPTDPNYASQAAYLQAMHLPDAWNTTTGDNSLILAIIDSGVQLSHPDLAGRLVPGWDFVNDDSDPSDDFGHGTMVAGIAAASTNNGRGVAGATWAGRIMPVKVLDSHGAANDDDIAAGIRYAVDHGASVINLSLGGPGAGTGVLQQAVNYATANDVVVVAAAGNDGGTSQATIEHYPAACDGVIAVGATDSAGNHAAFSSSGRWVDVVAPGVGIVTTATGSRYGSGDGTSFSAPLVSGVAFLMRSADPNASAQGVADTLVASADDLGAPGVDTLYGAGMVDAAAALTQVGFSSASTNGSGYWMLAGDGAVYRFGGATFRGNATPYLSGGATAVDLEPTPSNSGYWIVDTAGHVFAFNAPSFGNVTAPFRPGEQVASLSATPSGNGYWIFTTAGRVFAFGDAPKGLGDLANLTLAGPVLDSIATPSGRGYYMVGSDGGIFAFGDARFDGSMGGRPLNAPVQSLVPDPDGSGYWLVAADGGVFAFDAPFRGSMGGRQLNAPVTGMVPFGNGYLMVAIDGGAFDFSDQPFSGSLAGATAHAPIVSVAPRPAP